MKRLLSLILVAVLALSISVLPALAYTDTSARSEDAAIKQWGYLLVSDTAGAFEPNVAVTRGEFIHAINAIAKYPAASPTFQDVPVSHKYASDIGALQKAGVIEGSVKNVIFGPDDSLLREEAAKILGRAFGVPTTASATTFVDDAIIPDWAKPYVESLKTFAYMGGIGGNEFSPKASLNRAAVAQMLFNINPGTQAKDANYLVTASGTIKDKTFNNLVIAPNVTGTVTLDNVKVNGSLVVLGENGKATESYALNGSVAKAETLGSLATKAQKETYAAGALSIVIAGSSNIAQLFVQTVASVTINGNVGLVVIQQSAVSVTVGATAVVTTLVVTSVSLAVEITNNGTIGELDCYAKDTTIDNNGTIDEADHYSSVVVEGDDVDVILDDEVINDIYA